MPKYLVTNGSYFEPFTYDELAKPVMQAVEAHSATQDVYDTITAETEALRQYLLREPADSEARRLYDNYTAKLETLQNNLWTKGFNASTRRDLSAARAGYASDITRLGTAIKSRQDRSAEYWKTKHDHPDMIMGTDPGLSGLDSYLMNDRFGQDYFSYSGESFMNEVGTDAKARMDEMLNDPRILDKYPQLKGYIPILKKDGFSSQQVQNAVNAVRSYYGGNDKALDNLDFASGVLADVLRSHVDSTGARGKVSPTEFGRLLRYGEAGLSQSIGKSDVQFLKDLEWEQEQKLNTALKVAAAKASGRGGSGASGSYAPNIATLRGNTLSGISDKKQAQDFVDKTNVYQALDIINQLKKSGALRQPNGTLTDTANEAVMKLYKSPYYKELTKGKDHFLTDADLDSVISNLGKELNEYEQNDHMYQFNNTNAANSNIARNVFKPNIGQLFGKQGDKIAAANAHYSDGKSVTGKELMSILESDNLLIGFDAKSGNLTIQRNAADDSQDKGKYNDKVVYLNTRNALTGTSGYANAAAILYAFNSAVPDEVPSSDKEMMRNRISAMATMGQTIDLRDFADLIRGSYQSLVKDGDDNDRAVFNALVESFAQGLYDSANTPWAPNTYKEGWSAKTGGDYISNGEDEYFDYDFD